MLSNKLNLYRCERFKANMREKSHFSVAFYLSLLSYLLLLVNLDSPTTSFSETESTVSTVISQDDTNESRRHKCRNNLQSQVSVKDKNCCLSQHWKDTYRTFCYPTKPKPVLIEESHDLWCSLIDIS